MKSNPVSKLYNWSNKILTALFILSFAIYAWLGFYYDVNILWFIIFFLLDLVLFTSYSLFHSESLFSLTKLLVLLDELDDTTLF